MIPPFFRTLPLPDALPALIRAIGRQPCSAPILVDFSRLENDACQDAAPDGQWLSSTEENRLRELKLDKRRREWLAGRICAKIAVCDYLRSHQQGQKLPAYNEIQISNSEDGRPFVAWTGEEMRPQAPDISISHSGSLALALAARTCCGVDVQEVSDKLNRVKERFCTEQEALLVCGRQTLDPLMGLALLWTAKEAAKKALSASAMPGFTDLVLTGIDQRGDREWLLVFDRLRHGTPSPEQIPVIAALRQNSALGICIP
jgi:phosphopantetheinyl transferase